METNAMTRSAAESLSKHVSAILRHRAWEYGLEPDAEGWVPVEDLLEAMAVDGQQATVHDLQLMIDAAPRRRHELADGRIRALYGHSIPVLPPPRTDIPSALYHGTTPVALSAIERSGLRPGRRRYVHLATTPELALTISRRRSDHPVLLRIDARGATEAGVKFHRASEEIVLTPAVPTAFLHTIT
ncbi:MAG TPA: RNA 2'-phosphotransferase [Microlunatus sp.]|nr:RNA 2'-phosphotransferase [Microlunatus sp.]